ncbi:hypothetical protein GCM10009117_01950 [Gangjinia marincola]|uniref:Uncharacterized protein n=1 Tax=Gangjinia marincola TaxID=578463 RepID=A0ABN1ME98_9FLAO
MKYISTTKATNCPKRGLKDYLLDLFSFWVPRANLGYESKMHLVKIWLIEFKEEDGKFLPWREIALGLDGNPIFAGPSKNNYGFWLDTHMQFKDFDDYELIEKNEFEIYWDLSGVKTPDSSK